MILLKLFNKQLQNWQNLLSHSLGNSEVFNKNFLYPYDQEKCLKRYDGSNLNEI